MPSRVRNCLYGLVVVIAAAAGLVSPAAGQNRATRPKVDRPDGPVWQVIRKNCVACHGIDDYAFFAMDKDGWRNLLLTKHKTGPGANATNPLSEADWSDLLGWLGDKFGPSAQPFPRDYIAPEITEFLTDPEGNVIMARACTMCHSVERFAATRHSLDEWRVVLINMRERGARLSDIEVEGMAEWLSRVKGINPNQ